MFSFQVRCHARPSGQNGQFLGTESQLEGPSGDPALFEPKFCSISFAAARPKCRKTFRETLTKAYDSRRLDFGKLKLWFVHDKGDAKPGTEARAKGLTRCFARSPPRRPKSHSPSGVAGAIGRLLTASYHRAP